MKNLLFLLLVFGFLLGCEDGDNTDTEDLKISNSLVGEWQLVEQRVSIGGPATWTDVENGDTFILNENGTYEDFELFGACSTGDYEATEDELILTENCNPDAKPFTYFLTRSGETIIISPKTVICTETCEYKYAKVED